MANVTAFQGNPEGSLNEMQKAIELAPGQAQSYINMGALQEHAKQFDEAEASYKKAISLEPKSSSPLLMLGFFYRQSAPVARGRKGIPPGDRSRSQGTPSPAVAGPLIPCPT